jgi:hypothetical protein
VGADPPPQGIFGCQRRTPTAAGVYQGCDPLVCSHPPCGGRSKNMTVQKREKPGYPWVARLPPSILSEFS